MKKYLTLLFLSLALVSCNNNDDDNPASDRKVSEKQFNSRIAYNFWKLDRGAWFDADGNIMETYDMEWNNVPVVYGVYFTDSYAIYLVHSYYRTQDRRSILCYYTFDPKTSTVCDASGAPNWNDFRILSIKANEMTAETNFGVWISQGETSPRPDVYFRGKYCRMNISIMDFIRDELYTPQNFDSLP